MAFSVAALIVAIVSALFQLATVRYFDNKAARINRQSTEENVRDYHAWGDLSRWGRMRWRWRTLTGKG